MPLAHTYRAITAAYLLPDSVQVNFHCVPRLSPTDIQGSFYNLRATSLGLNKWRSSLRVGAHNYSVTFQYIPAGGAINCYVTIGILSQLHSPSSGAFLPEIPVQNKSRNWLQGRQMRTDNRHVWSLVDSRLASIRDALVRFFADFCREHGKALPEDLLRSTNVTLVEVCADLRCLNPRHYVRALVSSFATNLGEAEERAYGLTAPYTRLIGAGHMVSAFRKPDERFKAYCKTSARVRLECRLGKAGLKSAKIDYRLKGGRTFSAFFQDCAEYCAWYFNMLLQEHRLGINSNSQATPFDLLSCFASTVKSTHKLRELLDILVCEGSIANNFDRQLIDRLKRMTPPVLVSNQKRGHSTFAAQFRRAAWQLSRCQQSFSVASARRRPRTLNIIRGARPPRS